MLTLDKFKTKKRLGVRLSKKQKISKHEIINIRKLHVFAKTVGNGKNCLAPRLTKSLT